MFRFYGTWQIIICLVLLNFMFIKAEEKDPDYDNGKYVVPFKVSGLLVGRGAQCYQMELSWQLVIRVKNVKK